VSVVQVLNPSTIKEAYKDLEGERLIRWSGSVEFSAIKLKSIQPFNEETIRKYFEQKKFKQPIRSQMISGVNEAKEMAMKEKLERLGSYYCVDVLYCV